MGREGERERERERERNPSDFMSQPFQTEYLRPVLFIADMKERIFVMYVLKMEIFC